MVTERDYWRNETLKSQLFFTQYFYRMRHGRKFVVNPHHEIICDYLDDVFMGKETRGIINIAPRYSKTELAVKNLIARGLAINPAARFIHLTYAAKLALDNSEEAKDIVTSEAYQALFPYVQIKTTSKAKDKWYTTAGGGVYAAASGGQVTGFGAGKVDDGEEDPEADEEIDRIQEEQEIAELEAQLDEVEAAIAEFQAAGKFGGAIIIDDPTKPEDAFSDAKRYRVNERFETTIRSRANSRKTPIIVIQQRVHEEDLSGYLMKVEPDVWKVIRLPCLKPDGTALWPMKHTVEELIHLKLVNDYVFESQYQQDPKPLRKGGEAYKLFTKERNVIPNRIVRGLPELYNPNIPLFATFDFNIIPYITCLLHQVEGKRDIQIDEILLRHPRNRTEELCKEIVRKYATVHKSTLIVGGDPSGRHEDTRTEQGENDFTIIQKNLRRFKTSLRVLEKAPAVAMRIAFINSAFDGTADPLEFLIGSNCVKTIEDYQFGKEDSDRTKLKEVATDPVTKQTYQKYHHISDANDYHYCAIFASEYAKYQNGLSTGKILMGKSISKNRH